MPLNKHVALDIGSSAVTAMAAEILDNGKIKILSVESIASQVSTYGIVDNTSEASYIVVKLSKLLRNSAKLPAVEQISVGVNAKGTKSKLVTIEKFLTENVLITDELLFDYHSETKNKLSQNEIFVYDLIPVSYTLDDVRMDDPVGQKGIHLSATYNLIYGPLLPSEKLEGVFDRNDVFCNFKPLAIEALSAVLLSDEEREKGCVLMNFGATTTTAGVYFEGVLQNLMVLPLGGRNITKDISEVGISRLNAEKLKCLKGSASSSAIDEPVLIKIKSENPDAEPVKISTLFLAQIIEARLEEIFHPFEKFLEEINFPLPGGIIVTGGSSRLTGLADFLEQKTGLQVRAGNHSNFLLPDQQPIYADTAYSQLIGTIKLAHQYYIENPPEELIKKKRGNNKLRRGIKITLTDMLIDFFKDENSMEDENVNVDNKTVRGKSYQTEDNLP